ncbi:MAG: hypothetical protein ABIR26_01370 [Ramlibacter sp.]
MDPRIRKAKLVSGTHVSLRDVEVGDANFILSLRLDPKKSRYLSVTSDDLQDQISWLREYEQSGNQAYLVAQDMKGERLGCVRIYDPVGLSYSWGSWLMVDGLSPLISLETAVLVYAYARHLGFETARFAVRRANTYVWRFHERIFGARRVQETEDEYLYELGDAQILASLRKYRQLVPQPLSVQLVDETVAGITPGPGQ